MKHHHWGIGLGLILVVPAAAQDEQDRRERTLTRTRQLLEQRPSHAALFDRYFKLLVAGNAVEAEADTLRAKLEKDPGEQAVSIVLGRLLLRAGNEDEALDVLDAIVDKDSDTQLVLGDIYAKLARFDSAVRAYEAALPSATTSEQKRALFEKKGKAQLALGDKTAAVATWSAIGDLDGGKFHRRLRVAELLVEAGLLEEAEQAYQPLLAESESDPAQHCRVLRDHGRLSELRGELDVALATYRNVIELTARGNWLRKEVEGRIVQVYRRTGKLEELVAEMQGRVEAQPDDLGAHELLADVLLEMRELDRAAEVLSGVAPRFPRDVRLARRLAELHQQRGDTVAAIGEYQRILGERPDELELYLELGTLFAESEQLEEAKNQWEKALAKRLEDASMCTRLASMYALWKRDEDAIRLYERAVELEPDSMVRYTDLAEFLFARGHRERGEEALNRALEKGRGKPRRLEILAGAFREHDMIAAARSCLDELVSLEPDNHEAVYALADLMIDAGDVGPARDLLWRVVEAEGTVSGYRTMAANMLVFLAARAGDSEALLAEAEQRGTAGASFVAGRAYSRSRDFDAAIKAYRKVLEQKADDVEARRMLARLLAEEGDFEGALGQYESLALIAPGERRRQFREVARMHLELFDMDAAMDVWNRAMRDHPDVPAVFLEVGRELMEIQRVHEALDAFRQAARLKSRDPEILIRLAKALRQAGKAEEAEQQLLVVANEALDSRDREQARSELFELLAEQGAIDKRISALQASVDENPYDAHAPQLLADLYMRTGDYVLGLSMVETAIKFQPRNKELLARQAELLEQLEEWEKAHDVHAELLKFPDAERDVHLAGMGRSLYELGKADEAKEVFGQIRDRGRVSKLYEEYQLFDEAIDYYQRAIARNPGDYRAYVSLAEQLMERNRRDEAIAALEKVLNIRPYYRQALQIIGKLYVQSGRRDDAVAAGKRLFGLRGEEVRKTRREEYEEQQKNSRNRYNQYNQYRSRGGFNQRRLTAAQSYFEERGLGAEWGEILVAEAKRRPADLALVDAVRSHYDWRDKSARKHEAFLLELLGKDIGGMRIPPGYTRRSYREMLEERVVGIWEKDVAVAEDRIQALGDAPTGVDRLKRAVLYRSIGKMDACEADLRAVLEEDADVAVARVMLVNRLVEDKRFAEARDHLVALRDWWRGPGAEHLPELERRDYEGYKRVSKQMMDSLPRRVRRRVDHEDLLAVRARVQSPSFGKMSSFSFPEAVPQPFAVQKKLIRVAVAAEDQPAAEQAADQALEMAQGLAQRSSLGTLLHQEGLTERAARCLREVVDAGEELQADPVQVYFWAQYYQTWVHTAADPLAQITEERGDVLAAYHLLRENGHGEKAELLIAKHDAGGQVATELAAAVETAATALREARASSSSDVRNSELDYRDAVIVLADFEMAEKKFDRAEEIYVAATEMLPDDLDVRQVIADLRLRRGDADGAVAVHHEIIALKRRLRRARAGDTVVPPTRMTPTIPGKSAGSSITRVGSSSYYLPWYLRNQQLDVASNYLGILRIYSQHNDSDGILETLRMIMREDPMSFRTLAWEVLNQIRNQDLGAKKLPILRILKGAVGNDEWLTIQYATACREEGEVAEAKRTLEKMLSRSRGSQEWYIEQAERELEKVRQRLGESKITVADLRAEVEKDPDNVRRRMRLADRLKKEHEYAECLEHAQVVVEKAPYQKRAKTMVVEMAAASGADDVAVAMLRQLFDEATDSDDKIQQGVHLANWLYASGEVDEAFEIMDGLETQSGGSNQFSPGNWFLDRYRIERAVTHFESEIERFKTQPWYVDQVRQRLMRVELASGQMVAAVERSYQTIEEAGSLADREQKFKGMLGFLRAHPHPDRLYEALQAEYGARETTKQLLVMSSAALIKGDVAEAEAGFAKAASGSSKEVYLYPLLLGLRRMVGDWEGALGVLDDMGRVYGGSDTMQWSSGVSLSLRDRLKVERSVILRSMDRAEEADALVESLYDETEIGTMLTVSRIFERLGDLDRALEWRRRYQDKRGTPDKAALLEMAGLLVRLERYEDAFEPARQAFVMSRGANDARSTLTSLFQRTERTAEWIAEVEEEYAADERNTQVRGALLGLYEQQREDAKIRAIHVSMLEEPDQREQALNRLISMEQKQGDTAAAIEWMKQLLELVGGDEKDGVRKRLANLHVELEEWEAAEALFREALDLETVEGLRELAGWFAVHDRDDQALATFEAVLELDPEDDQVLSPLATLEWKAGHWEKALDYVVRSLREGRAKGSMSTTSRTTILDCLAGLTAERRAEVLGGGDTVEACEQAALAHYASGDLVATLEHANAAVELAADNLIGLDLRVTALRELERLDELPEAIEALRKRIEREYVTSSDWSYRNKATSLQDELGRLALQRGDREAADRLWKEQPLRREPYSNAFNSWRSDWNVRYTAGHWLASGDPESALAALDLEFLLRESPPWQLYLDALERSDRSDEAEAIAWRRLLDPLVQYGVRGGQTFFVYDPSDNQRVSHEVEQLCRLHWNRRDLDALETRARELAADLGTEQAGRDLLRRIATMRRDHESLAEAAERQMVKDEKEEDAATRHALVGMWLRAERPDKAREHLEVTLDFSSELVDRPLLALSSGSGYTLRSMGGSTSISASNPFSMSLGGGSSSYYSYWGRSRGNGLDDLRESAAMILFLQGEREAALAIENDLIERTSPPKRQDRRSEIARTYSRVVPQESIRLFRQVLDHPDKPWEDEERYQLLSELPSVYRRAGDAAGERTVHEERLVVLRRIIDAAPGPHALARRSQLIELLLYGLDRPAEALAELEPLIAVQTSARTYETVRAAIHMAMGEADRAVEIYRGQMERRAERGYANYYDASLEARLGIALIAAGQDEEGRELCWRAAPRVTVDSREDRRVREILGLR